MPPVVKEFAAAKINLALHVLGRRGDGLHELDSIVAFASIGDWLTLTPAATTSLRVTGPNAADVPGNGENLVLRAHHLLSAHVSLPPVAFELEKNLPVASGIGGGSADAAAALRGLLRLAKADLPHGTLNSIALQLGADVPVCLFGGACRMQGVGDVITPLAAVPAAGILLVNPRRPCSTAHVFKAMGLAPGQTAGTALDPGAPATWRNDMTAPAISVEPAIADVLEELRAFAPNATLRMSGSGATCFALCDSLAAAEDAAQALSRKKPQWWIAPATLR